MIKEIEAGILGAVINEPKLIDVISPLLKPEHFSEYNHLIVFKAIKELFNDREQIDTFSIINKIKSYKQLETIGGIYFITGLISSASQYGTLEKNSLLIIENHVLKSLEILAKKLEIKTKESLVDSIEIMQWIQNELKEIETGLKISETERIGNVIERQLLEIKESIETGVKSGVKSNLNDLDKQTNGWQNSDLIIIAGRPGMGKTSAAIQFALSPSTNNIPVAFFSLEMSKEQLANRVLSLISYMPVQKIVTKNINKYDLDLLNKDGQLIKNIPFFVDDSSVLTISDLTIKARKLKREHDIKLIILDYLQLMKGNGKNRENEISEISRGLKLLAKELNIPIIALSQLSRSVESRSDKKPMLSDLRESGAIEQDADMVIFTYRPKYYDFNEYELGGQIYPTNDLMIFIISKFRQGSPGEIKARWIAEQTKICNYESDNIQNNTNFLNEF